MLNKLAMAVTVGGAVVTTSAFGAGAVAAQGSDPTTTTTTGPAATTTTSPVTSTTSVPAPPTTVAADPATTAPGAPPTTSTTAAPAPTTTVAATPTPVAHPSTKVSTKVSTKAAAGATANPDAYYGNAKAGVEVSSSAPGLFPVFGESNTPDLSGFDVVATPADGAAPVDGVSEPQPVCSPSTPETSTTAGVYCEADTDRGFEFPMSSVLESFDQSVSATPPGWYHDPGQTLPVSTTVFACTDLPGVDGCGPITEPDVSYFDYIGIFRPLEVTVQDSAGSPITGVSVSLTCSAPDGYPTDSCPGPDEKTNVGSPPVVTADSVRASANGTTASTTTGPGGIGTFAGIYVPGASVTLAATPPAGYNAASATVTVPSPVSASTTTGPAVSAAARTAVDVVLTLTKAAPATTTTTVPPTTVPPTTTTSTTVAPATTTTTRVAAAASGSLPLTGGQVGGLVSLGGAGLLAGSGLVVSSRRRARRGAHFKR